MFAGSLCGACACMMYDMYLESCMHPAYVPAYMRGCLHTTTCVPTYHYLCTYIPLPVYIHTTTSVPTYYYLCTYIPLPVYLHTLPLYLHTTTCVPTYHYLCTYIPLPVYLHTTTSLPTDVVGCW